MLHESPQVKLRKQDIPSSLSRAYESYVANSLHRPNSVRFLSDDIKTNLQILGFDITTQDKSSLIHMPSCIHTISENYRSYIQGLLDNNHIEEDQVIHPLLFLRDQDIYFDLYDGTNVEFAHQCTDDNILSHNDWQKLRAKKFLPVEMQSITKESVCVHVLHDFIHFAVMMDPVIMQGFNNGYNEIHKFMPDAEVPRVFADLATFGWPDFDELRRQITQFRNTPLANFRSHLKRCMLYRLYLIEEELVLPDIASKGAKEIIALTKKFDLNESNSSLGNYDSILKTLKNMPEESWVKLLGELQKVLSENPDMYCIAGAGAVDGSDGSGGVRLLSEVNCILSSKKKNFCIESAAFIFANFLVGEDLNINLATILSQGLNPRMTNDDKTAKFFHRAYPRNSAIAKCFEGVTHKQLRRLFNNWYRSTSSLLERLKGTKFII